MKRRLVILTELIAPYRIPVFNALAARSEVDLHVIFLSETDPSLRQWPVYKDQISFSYEVLPHWRRRLGKYNLLVNRGVSDALDRIQPDAVVCGGYSYLSSWSAARWARRYHVPLLLWSESTVNDARDSHGPVEFLKGRFVAQCSAFVVPGKSSFGYLCSLGVHADRIFVAPNAVDIEFFSAAAQNAQALNTGVADIPLERFFVYVGRLVIQKGIFELLEAYATLEPGARSKVGLVFIGDGPATLALQRRIAEIKEPHVYCAGFLNRERLAHFYTRADALVLPTYTDTWGLVVNEAMACGTPVIATSVAGCVPDLIEEGITGFVVPPRDVPALATAMAMIARDPELKGRMKRRCSQLIRSFSPQTWAEGVAQAFEFACARAA